MRGCPRLGSRSGEKRKGAVVERKLPARKTPAKETAVNQELAEEKADLDEKSCQ